MFKAPNRVSFMNGKQVERVESTKAVVLRMYEAFGSHTGTTLTTQLPVKAYQR